MRQRLDGPRAVGVHGDELVDPGDLEDAPQIGAGPGEGVRLRAEALVDDLRLTVADTGSWKTPRPERDTHRGRGITLMRAMMREVTITPGPAGTTADMHTRIAR